MKLGQACQEDYSSSQATVLLMFCLGVYLYAFGVNPSADKLLGTLHRTKRLFLLDTVEAIRDRNAKGKGNSWSCKHVKTGNRPGSVPV
ncbi:hypothetical protein LY78DRAFT_197820 [Colletotrichum sublineola]|nr:hypothetical protein LY78DRAFT_197820 [Colletotrichum sublineola]